MFYPFIGNHDSRSKYKFHLTSFLNSQTSEGSILFQALKENYGSFLSNDLTKCHFFSQKPLYLHPI